MSRVLETRTVARDVKRRRYERKDGSRFTTVEVPLTVLTGIGMRRVQEAIQRYERGEAKRATARARLARAESLLRDGVKPTAIAHELGVSDARVRQIRKAMAAQP